MTSPFNCKDCERRYPGCHDHCEQYQAAKAINEQRKYEENLQRQAGMYTYHHVGHIRDMQAKRRRDQSGYTRFSKGSG